MIGFLLLVGFAATIPFANWLIGNFGTVCVPDGPCLIPVAPGLMAPSGVLMVGLALVLRDLVHESLGRNWVFAAIVIGGALSAAVAPAALVFASVTAFVFSELADMAVYSPLREKHLYWAVILSGLAGSIVDSAAFLFIAFGNLDFIWGQIVGKMWMSLLALPMIYVLRGKLSAAT